MSTEYFMHEIKRHNQSIKEAVTRACGIVFADSPITHHIKGTAWSLWSPSEQVTITVFKKAGMGSRQPICEIIIDRPRSKQNRYVYSQANAVLHDWSEHPGNTRLLGHLQRHCSFLPKLAVKLNYELREHQ